IDAGGLAAGDTADGGPSFVMLNAGTLTLSDATTNTTVATTDWGPMTHGFGWAEGYPSPALLSPGWKAGDLLTVSATGEQVGGFKASLRAVEFPTVRTPSTINRSENAI